MLKKLKETMKITYHQIEYINKKIKIIKRELNRNSGVEKLQ